MKTPLLKYLVLTTICSLSSYSYWYLNARTLDLQTQRSPVMLNPSASADQTMNLPFVQPPAKEKDSKKDNYRKKGDEDLLPDVQLLKFIIDKGKEGIPVLSLPSFFR